MYFIGQHYKGTWLYYLFMSKSEKVLFLPRSKSTIAVDI